MKLLGSGYQKRSWLLFVKYVLEVYNVVLQNVLKGQDINVYEVLEGHDIVVK